MLGTLLEVGTLKKCTVVVRSACRKQHVKKPSVSERFWKFRCWKSARHCGAKHISKSKCTKHIKTPHVRATFGGSDVEKVHAVVVRRTFRSKHVKNTRGSDHFWRFRCRFASLHYTTLHCITLHYAPLHYITLHYTTFHYTSLHYITLHYTPLRYNYNYSTTLNYTPLD